MESGPSVNEIVPVAAGERSAAPPHCWGGSGAAAQIKGSDEGCQIASTFPLLLFPWPQHRDSTVKRC